MPVPREVAEMVDAFFRGKPRRYSVRGKDKVFGMLLMPSDWRNAIPSDPAHCVVANAGQRFLGPDSRGICAYPSVLWVDFGPEIVAFVPDADTKRIIEELDRQDTLLKPQQMTLSAYPFPKDYVKRKQASNAKRGPAAKAARKSRPHTPRAFVRGSTGYVEQVHVTPA